MINLLLKEPIGIIVGYNIISALKEDLISIDIVKDLLGKCVKAFTENSVNETSHLIGQFVDVINGDRPLSGPKKKFHFACKNSTRLVTERGEFSTAVDFFSLKSHLIRRSALISGHAYMLSSPHPNDSVYLKFMDQIIEQLNGKKDIYRPGAQLGSNPKSPLFWITPSQEPKQERMNNPLEALGDAIRDLLGLYHHEKNIPLIEIRISGNKIRSRKHARPTFADAGFHKRFRNCPESKAAKKTPGWGWTVHLDKLTNPSLCADGAKERIVEPIPFNEDLGAILEFAGCTKITRGLTSSDDDKAFSVRLSNGVSLMELKKFLLDIIP